MDRDDWSLAVLFLLLTAILAVLIYVAVTLPNKLDQIAASTTGAVSRDRVKENLTKRIGEAFAGDHKLPALDARKFGNALAEEILKEIEQNPTGDVARSFAELLSGPEARSDETLAQARQAEVTKSVKDSLKKMAERAFPAGSQETAKSIIDAITPEQLTEIKKGFLNGLGVLPLDFLKWFASNLTSRMLGNGKDVTQSITVSCCACEQREKPPDKQPSKGSNLQGDPPKPCPAVVRKEFRISSFAPDQPSAGKQLTGEQQAAIEAIASFSRTVKDPIILVRAWTDTTAWEIKGHNEQLAMRRAEAVRDALVAARVPRSRVLFAPLWTNELPDDTSKGVPSASNRVVKVEVQSLSEMPAASR